MDIRNLVLKLCEKYKTTSVYELADAMGICIYYHDLSPLRGYYFCEHRIKNIVVHFDLPDHMRRFILGHEMGHAIMHPNINAPFLQNTLFSTDKYEIEANKFSVELLIPDKELQNHTDFTVDQWSSFYGLPREIISLKLWQK